MHPASGLVGRFLTFTSNLHSPFMFRLWAALWGVASAVERRVWWDTGDGLIYPNIYALLVGPPGTGKSRAIAKMEQLLVDSGTAKLGPQDMSKQGLLDALAHKDNIGGWYYLGDNGRYEMGDYHYLTLAISEIADFMPMYDGVLTGLLTKLWDCLDVNSESKRHGLGKVIESPGLSMIVGAATRSLGNIVPSQEWGTGFTARLMLVYSDEQISTRLGKRASDDKLIVDELHHHLRTIATLNGPIKWEPDALDAIQDFKDALVEPPHPRLEDYYVRRWFHLAKLCMHSSLSDARMCITMSDYKRALEWLTHTEDTMTEIFPKMFVHEDTATHQQFGLWIASECKRRGVDEIPVADANARAISFVGYARYKAFLDASVRSDYVDLNPVTNGYAPGRRGTAQ